MRLVLTLTRWMTLLIGAPIVLLLAAEIVYRAQGAIRNIGTKAPVSALPAVHPYAQTGWFADFLPQSEPVFVHDSYRQWVVQPMQSRGLNVGEDGYRLTPKLATASPTRRVLMLGGSVMWGRFARDEYTIPSHVGRLLADKSYTDVEVLNRSQPYFNFTQDSITLLTELARGESPAAVVFLNGVTDMQLADRHGRAGHADNERKNRRLFERGWGAKSVAKDLEDVLQHSELLQRLGVVLVESDVAADSAPVPCEDVARYYHQMAVSVASLGASHGFPVFFFRQPGIGDRKEPRPVWEQRWPAVEQHQACAKVIDSLMISDPRLKYESLHDLFYEDSAPRFMRADGSLTEDGNLIVATRIAARLDSLGQSRSTESPASKAAARTARAYAP